jgi:hypothetical protein
MNDIVKIPLKNGGFAIIDAIDEKYTKGYNWTINKMGVVTYLHKQKIYLHNLIAPYKRVSFKDNNRCNCRRNNLVKTQYVNSFKRKASVRKFKNKFYIRRSVTINGKNWRWHHNYRFGQKCRFKNEEDAKIEAEKQLKYISDLTEFEFLEFVKNKKSERKSTYDIICDWDLYDGKNFSQLELMQFGIKSS